MAVLQASVLAGSIERMGHKWLKRFRDEGTPGLRDRTSHPHRLARSHELGLVVEAVGRRRRGQAAVRIAQELGVARSTAGLLAAVNSRSLFAHSMDRKCIASCRPRAAGVGQ
jgi:hypothetical protein